MNIAIQRFAANASTLAAQATDTAAQDATVSELVIHDDIAAALPAWQRLLEGEVIASPFQAIPWISLWHAHAGVAAGAKPLIVVGRNHRGDPLFVWPLIREKRAGTVLARFFGGSHSNFNMGVWRRDAAAAMTALSLRRLLDETARHARADLFYFTSQPQMWERTPNPFALLPHRPVIDDVDRLDFGGLGGAQVLEARLKPAMRGRLRTKERKLQKIAGYRYLRAKTDDEVKRILDAFFVQKAAQFAAQGIADVFARPGIADFITHSCLDGLEHGHPTIELHALEGGGEVIALLGGVSDATRFSCMFNSYTTGEAGRWSPGLVLITHIIPDCADRGLTTFDLGPGHASYKHFFCKDPEHLFDTLVPITLRGALAARWQRVRTASKRWIKSNPALLAKAQSLRRVYKGQRTTSSADRDEA